MINRLICLTILITVLAISGCGTVKRQPDFDVLLQAEKAAAVELDANSDNKIDDTYLPIGSSVQAYDADLDIYAGITPAADIQTFLGYDDFAAIKAGLSLDDVWTTLGVTDGDTDMGEYTGSTITSNGTAKENIQELETEVEAKQNTVTAGSLTNEVIKLEDLAKEAKTLREEITTDADPYEITPTGNWDGYENYFLVITTHAADVSFQLTETGPPPNGCQAVLYLVAGNDADMADIDAQQELIPDGVTKTIEIGEIKTFVYETDRWVEKNKAANEKFSSFTTVETEFIPIGYMIDGASAPDALATLTSGTDKVNARTFAGDADEDVVFDWEIPHDLDTTTGIKFRVICAISSATGPSAETWQFELHGFSLGDGDALDGTLGTAQTSNSGSRTDAQYDRMATAWSSAMTSTHITDLAVGETAQFKLYRDISDTDDYEQNVAVIGIELKYKRDHDTTF